MKTLMAAAAAAMAFALATGARAATPEACAALAKFEWPHLRVDEAQLVAKGPAPADGSRPGDVAPEHCLFRGVIHPRSGAGGQTLGIGIELRLPTDWNGRFAFQGGGGLDGVLHPALGSIFGTLKPSALQRGFAVVSTDGGHRGASMLDARFGVDQQARIDYAYNAVDKATLLAKALIKRFYGRPPDRSYFLGCSNGGRQGLIAVQRLPLEFDGVVSGDPTLRLAWTNVGQAWNEVVLARIAPKAADGRPILSRAISDEQLRRVAEEVLRQCDDADGLADGMINDFRACRFDPRTVVCKASEGGTCLSRAQADAFDLMMQGPRDSNGTPLYAAFPYDTGISDPAFRRMHFGSSPTGQPDSADATLGFDSLRYYAMTPPAPRLDPFDFDFDRDTARIRETSKLNDADAAFVSTFARRGKLILYHGLSDQGLSPLDTAAWYDRLQDANEGPVEDWARLFMVPGMTHCSGGRSTDQFDMLSAIQAWVEDGRAPDRIVARGEAFPGVSRPLCPYPKLARFRGGDAKDEKSFACEK